MHRQRTRRRFRLKTGPAPAGASVRAQYRRTCPGCGETFEAKNRRRRFCSPRSRQRARRPRLGRAKVGAAGEDIRVRVAKQPRAASGKFVVVKNLPVSRCRVCFGPVPAGESYCDEDCERIRRDQPAAADREPATGVLRVPYQVIRLDTTRAGQRESGCLDAAGLGD
jgi:hypothetical protein